MKRLVILLLFCCPVLFSCDKDSNDSAPVSLEGTWKMILVKDNTTGTSITKPSSVTNDVIITISTTSPSTGKFWGYTPSNTIDENRFTVTGNQGISITELSMTKVAETSWGDAFVKNIIDAQHYSFEAGGKLNILAINKTLTFQKL
jgi:hypothetical protein